MASRGAIAGHTQTLPARRLAQWLVSRLGNSVVVDEEAVNRLGSARRVGCVHLQPPLPLMRFSQKIIAVNIPAEPNLS